MDIAKLKEDMCEMGRRLYNKGFAAGNDGNITVRIGENEVLCTPTMISKGFMKPEDICHVDMEGNQLAGVKKRTSEVRLHLTIMKQRPDVKAVVHCHPPHATAFAIAREPIPQSVLPEVEIFLGDVPIAKYIAPGGQEFADTVIPYAKKSNIIILANHGTVSFSDTVEKAYWWTEILDAYCKMLMLAKDLGRISYFTPEQAQELIDLKVKWGYSDPRCDPDFKGDIRTGDVFKNMWDEAGVSVNAFEPPVAPGKKAKTKTAKAKAGAKTAVAEIDVEALVARITKQVLKELGQ
ncbi:MAG TPA: class II aldolase/adducin family protein [Pirellulales bacterium]